MKNNDEYLSDDATLQRWHNHVESFEHFISKGHRNEAVQRRDYFDDRQWTEEEKAQLEDSGQPVITDNRVKPKVMFIMGVEATQRTDPKAFPVEESDEQGSDLATKILRHVADDNDSDQRFSDGFEYMNIEGIEAHIVLGYENKVLHSDIPYNRYLYDPHSSDRMFSDKKWDGMAVWLDEDDILSMWKDADESLLAEAAYENQNTYLQDAPNDNIWYDSDRQRFRVVQLFVRERGVWREGIFTKAGWLEKPQTSRWLDCEGQPSNPIVSGSPFIDKYNDRYSIMRQMMSPQDEINKRKSKALHWADSRQIGVTGNASRQDIETLREEAHKADGVLHLNNQDASMTVLDNPNMTSTQLAFMNLAIEAIDASGPNPSLQGKDESLRSGRAIRANQSSGILELTRVFDTHQTIKKMVYVKIWERTKQFYTSEKTIRITEPNQSKSKFVKLNEKTTVEKAIKQKFKGNELAAIEASTEYQLKRNDETVLNQVGQINADIKIEPVPDTINLQEEIFSVLGQALQYMPPERAAIAADIMLENMPIPNKQSMLDRLKGKSEDPEVLKQQEQQQAEAKQIKDLNVQRLVAEVEDTEAAADLKAASAYETLVNAGVTLDNPPQIGEQPSA